MLGKARPALRAARHGDQPDMEKHIAPTLERQPMARERAPRIAAPIDHEDFGLKQSRIMNAARRALLGFALLAAAAVLSLASLAPARADQIGPVSGLPLPRYVSLKSDRVNLREGPSKDHRTTWVFLRAGLPVEITAEFDIWRKVRDSEGAEGWVLHSLLSGRRTALVTPWKKGVDATLRAEPNAQSASVAILQPNVIANVRSCDGAWCRVFGEGFKGFIQQSDLWGVYPNEKIE
jgi:SH3-like domain-containing protein